MAVISEPTLRAISMPITEASRKQTAVDEFADSLEGVINNAKNLLPDQELRVYCMGRNGVDFRVGRIQITSSGVTIVSGQDNAGNSVYAVSHFQRMQFVCEVSKVDPNEKTARQPIGFVKGD